jgi:hypothetical protein
MSAETAIVTFAESNAKNAFSIFCADSATGTPRNAPELRPITAPARAFCAIMLHGVAPINSYLNRKCALALARAAGGSAFTDKYDRAGGQINSPVTENVLGRRQQQILSRPRGNLALRLCRSAGATGNRQQATGNRQQATGNRQQATGNRQQATLYTLAGNRDNYLIANLNHTNNFYAVLLCKLAAIRRSRIAFLIWETSPYRLVYKCRRALSKGFTSLGGWE